MLDTGAGLATAASAASPLGRHAVRRRLGSEQIFCGSDEVEIDHRGALYRLRITAMGRLILTK